MSNQNIAQISGKISHPVVFLSETNPSLTNETLSIVGTAQKGPAFVPTHVTSFNQSNDNLSTWENNFGLFADHLNVSTNFNKNGPITANIWLSNNTQATYTRVLGIGDGSGIVDDNYEYSGFIIGDSPISGSITKGKKDQNSFAIADGSPGRTRFLGKVVEDQDLSGYVSPYRDYIKQMTSNDDINVLGIVTDVVFETSGSQIYLQDDELDDLKRSDVLTKLNTVNTTSIVYGNSTTALSDPKIYLQGYNEKEKLILSLEKANRQTNFKESSLNRKNCYYLHKGNLNYASFKDTSGFADRDGSENQQNTYSKDIKYFLTKSKEAWNTSGQDFVNYESFESIYTRAKTPWIVSQPETRFGTSNKNKEDLYKTCKKLFRFHTYTDGISGNNYRFKIVPRRLGDENVVYEDHNSWSKFDIYVYEYNESNNNYNEILYYEDINLNPKSENYICKRIGTEHEIFSLETKEVQHVGFYKKTNNHIYVEVTDDVEYTTNKNTLIPCGFMPYPHLNISKSKLDLHENAVIDEIIQNPLKFSGNRLISSIKDDKIIYANHSGWGIKFDKTILKKLENINIGGVIYNFAFEESYNQNNEVKPQLEYAKYFQNYKEQKFWVESLTDTDDDPHNNFFHLERILYLKDLSTVKSKWQYAFYRRDGKDISNLEINDRMSDYSYVNIDEVLRSSSEADAISSSYLSFDFFTYGGFDGVNILDENKETLNQTSVFYESHEEIVGEYKGQTCYSYEIAKDIALDIDNFRCDVFIIPGISTHNLNRQITDFAESSKRFSYIFDVINYNENSETIKDGYYFNNLENRITSLLDERDAVKKELQDATDLSLDLNSIELPRSKYSIAVMNYCEARIANKAVVLPPSVAYVLFLSQTNNIAQPVDKTQNASTLCTLTNPINSKFVFNNEEFDKLLIKCKDKNYSINPIGVLSSGMQTKLLSANTLLKEKNNLFSLHHNCRIFLNIKRNLQNLLIVQNTINNQPVLFNLNSQSNLLFKIDLALEEVLNNFFQNYASRGIIKNYYVNVNVINSKINKQNSLKHVFKGEVGFSLFGNKTTNRFINLSIDNLINEINDFTEDNSINIININ